MIVKDIRRSEPSVANNCMVAMVVMEHEGVTFTLGLYPGPQKPIDGSLPYQLGSLMPGGWCWPWGADEANEARVLANQAYSLAIMSLPITSTGTTFKV